MKTIQGPGLFLAQFLRDTPPYDTLENISRWAYDLGYRGIQLPAWDARVIDLDKAAESKSYCEDYLARLQKIGLAVTELSTHLFGQVVAMHPAYAEAFQAFYPNGMNDKARSAWATDRLKKSIAASANMGLKSIPSFSGSLLWPMLYPWPQRPQGLVEEGFRELGLRWKPILDAAGEKGIVFSYELHPGSDLFDGATFEMFLEELDNHPSLCINYDPSHFILQQLDYLEFIEIYGERIKSFHVKDAEFRGNGRVGVYGGYQSWEKRAGRFRSLGDGQVDFKRVFTLLTEKNYDGWAVLEWECCIKSPEQGAREGAPFIASHIIQATDVAFDDFAGAETDRARNRRLLGLA